MKIVFLNQENQEIFYLQNFSVITDTGNSLIIECEISISTDCISVKDKLTYLSIEFSKLINGLKDIRKKEEMIVNFQDLDSRFLVSLKKVKSGHIYAECKFNSSMFSSKLDFDFIFDQTYIDRIILDLNYLIKMNYKN
jgi:hypothetical protein